MADFLLSGIDPAPLQPLFDLDDAGLAAHGAVRRIADSRRHIARERDVVVHAPGRGDPELEFHASPSFAKR